MSSFYDLVPLPTPRSIRLVKVLPRAPNGLIRVRLRVISLDDIPANLSISSLTYFGFTSSSFIALSYACGDQNDRIEIECNGFLMTVTKSLHHFLARPHVHFARQFWIDALCINQSQDLHALRERASQVQMMGEIYSKASIVWIELGESSKTVDAFGVQVLLPAEKALRELNVFSFGDMVALDTKIKRGDANISYPSSFLHVLGTMVAGLKEISTLPWFQRVWMVQEFALSQHEPLLHCGQWTFQFSTLMFILGRINDIDSRPQNTTIASSSLAALSSLHYLRLLLQDGTGLHFHQTWRHFRDRYATDHRDYIYAQLALNIDVTANNFAVDYLEDLESLLGRTSLRLVQEERLSVVLYHGRTVTDRGISWHLPLPDRDSTPMESIDNDFETICAVFAARGKSKGEIPRPSISEIKVRGRIISLLSNLNHGEEALGKRGGRKRDPGGGGGVSV